jgi:hypothetical protein
MFKSINLSRFPCQWSKVDIKNKCVTQVYTSNTSHISYINFIAFIQSTQVL